MRVQQSPYVQIINNPGGNIPQGGIYKDRNSGYYYVMVEYDNGMGIKKENVIIFGPTSTGKIDKVWVYNEDLSKLVNVNSLVQADPNDLKNILNNSFKSDPSVGLDSILLNIVNTAEKTKKKIVERYGYIFQHKNFIVASYDSLNDNYVIDHQGVPRLDKWALRNPKYFAVLVGVTTLLGMFGLAPIAPIVSQNLLAFSVLSPIGMGVYAYLAAKSGRNKPALDSKLGDLAYNNLGVKPKRIAIGPNYVFLGHFYT